MTEILIITGIIVSAIASGISLSALMLHGEHKTTKHKWRTPLLLGGLFWALMGFLLERITHDGYTITEARYVVCEAYLLLLATTAISLIYVRHKKEPQVKAFIACLEGSCLCCQEA